MNLFVVCCVTGINRFLIVVGPGNIVLIQHMKLVSMPGFLNRERERESSFIVDLGPSSQVYIVKIIYNFPSGIAHS